MDDIFEITPAVAGFLAECLQSASEDAEAEAGSIDTAQRLAEALSDAAVGTTITLTITDESEEEE